MELNTPPREDEPMNPTDELQSMDASAVPAQTDEQMEEDTETSKPASKDVFPRLASQLGAHFNPADLPEELRDPLKEKLALGWNKLGEPVQQDRDQFLRDFCLRSTVSRSGATQFALYPNNVYGTPKKFSFLQQAGLIKKGKKQVCELTQQELALLQDRVRPYVYERMAGVPLFSLDPSVKGLMFSKPVHDKIFVTKIMELLKIAKDMARDHRENIALSQGLPISDSGMDRAYMADQAAQTIFRLTREVHPGKDTIEDSLRNTIVLEVGADSTSPHRLTRFNFQTKTFETKTEADYAMDNTQLENPTNPVDKFADFVIGKFLMAAEYEKTKIGAWESPLLRIIGFDTEGFLNISKRACPGCGGSGRVSCAKNTLERIHMMIGTKYITILFPALKAKNIDAGQFGPHEIPTEGRSEGLFTCEGTTYMTRLLAPVFRLFGSRGPFVAAAFDVRSEQSRLDSAVRALGLADILADENDYGWFVSFIEADYYQNPMFDVVGLPTNLDANYKRGSNAQQLFVTGVCTPTNLWWHVASQGRADYHKIHPDTSSPLELFTYLYHRADAAYPRLAVYLLLASSLFLSVHGMEIEDEPRCEALMVCLIEKLVRLASGEIWQLKTNLRTEYWELVGDWILDGKIPSGIERTIDGTDGLAKFAKKYRINNFPQTRSQFSVPAPASTETQMDAASLSEDIPQHQVTARELLDLTIMESSMIEEPEVDSPLPLTASHAEIMQYIDSILADSQTSKLSSSVAEQALRYLAARSQAEIRRRQRDARNRTMEDFEKETAKDNSTILLSTRIERNARPRIAGLKSQIVRAHEDIAQIRKEVRAAVFRRDEAGNNRQMCKARLRAELNIVAKTTIRRIEDESADLKQYVLRCSEEPEAMTATLAEIEAANTVPRRRFSEPDRARVCVPNWDRPAFIPEEDDANWRETAAHKFRIWWECKRLLEVMNDPQIVTLFHSIKGTSHLGGLYSKWSRGISGINRNHLSWRDIRCAHAGWAAMLRPTLPKEGPSILEGRRIAQRVTNTCNRVSLRLFDVKAELPWSYAWAQSVALNPTELCKKYNVTPEVYDGEMQSWMANCKYSHVRLEGDSNSIGPFSKTLEDYGITPPQEEENSTEDRSWATQDERSWFSMVNDSSQPEDVLIVSHDELQAELDKDAEKGKFAATDVRLRLASNNSVPETGYRESSRDRQHGQPNKDLRDVVRPQPVHPGKKGGQQGKGGPLVKKPARNVNHQAKQNKATTSRGHGPGGNAPDSTGKRTASKSNSDRGSKRQRRRKSTKEASSKTQPTSATSGQDKGNQRES